MWEVLYLLDESDDDASAGETTGGVMNIVYLTILYSVVYKGVKLYVFFLFKAAVDREGQSSGQRGTNAFPNPCNHPPPTPHPPPLPSWTQLWN